MLTETPGHKLVKLKTFFASAKKITSTMKRLLLYYSAMIRELILLGMFPFVTLLYSRNSFLYRITALTHSVREYFENLALKESKKPNFKRLYLKNWVEFRVKTEIF